MANETTYALINTLLPDVYEAALMYAQESFIMPQLVTVYTDQTGMQARIFSEYASGTVATGLGETDNLDAQTQAFTRSQLASLTPGEIGTQFVVTDRRVNSDDVDVLADLAQHIGYTIFQQIEADLLGHFANFTGGSIGTASQPLTWAHVYAARARLAAANVPPPYNLVLSEYQYYDLATAANIASITAGAPLRVRDEIQSRYYVASVGDVDIYTTSALEAGTTVNGGMFSRGALALDIRRAMRIELQRDASLRATEVNATMVYAHGLRRAAWGVTVVSDGSAPTGAAGS
jgi:hypothetical protein